MIIRLLGCRIKATEIDISAPAVMQFTDQKLDFIDLVWCLQIIYFVFRNPSTIRLEIAIQHDTAKARERRREEQTGQRYFSFSRSKRKARKLLRRGDILMFFYCHFSIYTVIFFNGSWSTKYKKVLKANKSSNFSINMHFAQRSSLHSLVVKYKTWQNV